MESVARPNGTATSDEVRSLLRHVRCARMGARYRRAFPVGLAHLFIDQTTLFSVCADLAWRIEALNDPAVIDRHGYGELDFRTSEVMISYYGLGDRLPLSWREVGELLPRLSTSPTRPGEMGMGPKRAKQIEKDAVEALARTLPCLRPNDPGTVPTEPERPKIREYLRDQAEHVQFILYEKHWLRPVKLDRGALADLRVARASIPATSDKRRRERFSELIRTLEHIEEDSRAGRVFKSRQLARGKAYRRARLAWTVLRFASEGREADKAPRPRSPIGPRFEGPIPNCFGLDPDIFYPEHGFSTKEAKEICAACAVRVECLEYALVIDEEFGVWGGMSERERGHIRRIRREMIQARQPG